MKAKVEKEKNIDLGKLALPMDAGTTMTVALVSDRRVLVAWCGDSRAVMARASRPSLPSLPSAAPVVLV